MSNCFAADPLILNGMNITAKLMPTLHMPQRSDIFYKTQFTQKNGYILLHFCNVVPVETYKIVTLKKYPLKTIKSNFA